MRTRTSIDWLDVERAAKQIAGNWKGFESFAWHRSYEVEEPAAWLIHYTSHRDSGLLAKANEAVINERLDRFTEDEDPDVVYERHKHFAVGYIDGFSLRAFRPDGTISEAFKAFCDVMERLENHPVLDELVYSELEHEATLENYRNEIGLIRDTLPEGWESEVYSHFSHTGHDKYIESRDDQGGYASRDALLKALTEMGLIKAEAG